MAKWSLYVDNGGSAGSLLVGFDAVELEDGAQPLATGVAQDDRFGVNGYDVSGVGTRSTPWRWGKAMAWGSSLNNAASHYASVFAQQGKIVAVSDGNDLYTYGVLVRAVAPMGAGAIRPVLKDGVVVYETTLSLEFQQVR